MREVLVVLRDLELLIVEMLLGEYLSDPDSQKVENFSHLDGLEIDERIDSYGSRLVVCFICIATESCPIEFPS